jgi:hypothetical protein
VQRSSGGQPKDGRIVGETVNGGDLAIKQLKKKLLFKRNAFSQLSETSTLLESIVRIEQSSLLKSLMGFQKSSKLRDLNLRTVSTKAQHSSNPVSGSSVLLK